MARTAHVAASITTSNMHANTSAMTAVATRSKQTLPVMPAGLRGRPLMRLDDRAHGQAAIVHVDATLPHNVEESETPHRAAANFEGALDQGP
eukprot:1291059-Lingulodinium_polyedra.AAC.1